MGFKHRVKNSQIQIRKIERGVAEIPFFSQFLDSYIYNMWNRVLIIYVDGGDELGNITFVLIIIYRSIYIY